MEIYFIFGAMISFFIFGNLGIHLYYKKKHESFLDSLKGKDFTLIKNLDMEMESSGKIGYRYQFNKSDVVILENEIFLLLFNKPIKQAQPILQISNSNFVSDNISKKITFDSKFRVQGKLKIQGTFGKGITSEKYKIFLDFNKTDFDLNIIFESCLNE